MLCNTFATLAQRTWHRMRLSETTKVLLGETAITSLNLQDLIAKHSAEIDIVDFSPIVEARVTGADWEWWFVDGAQAIGFAIQAKRLDGGRYDVGYKPRNYAYQINTLLRYSWANGLLPLYCWYNYLAPKGGKSYPQYWGCAVADGYSVYQHHKRKEYTAGHLLPISVPWHALACEFDKRSVAGIHHMSHLLRHVQIDTVSKRYALPRNVGRVDPNPGLLGLPARVRSLLTFKDRIHEGAILDIPVRQLPRALVVVRKARS